MSQIKTEKILDNSETTLNSSQVEILYKHFPQCFDKSGNFILEKFNELISDSGTAFSKESYGLDWLGKSYARLLANERPLTLLAEDKEHNAKPQNRDSENLLIKGDNLEVLKHLKGAYSEAIKMIYIDPPYNTGSDGFVYQDDRKFTPAQLAELAGVHIEEAERILEFTQSKANSHSAWLTFMYPRLYIARELLKDDGVIFISIDDNEQAQLKILCDEVFGENNFIAKIIHKNNSNKNQTKLIGVSTEYMFAYARSLEQLRAEDVIWRIKKKGASDIVNYFINNVATKDLTELLEDIKELYKRPKYAHLSRWNKIDSRGVFMDGDLSREGGDKSYTIVNPHTKLKCPIPSRGWGKSYEELLRLQSEDLIYYGNGTTAPREKNYLEADSVSVPDSFWYFDDSTDTRWVKNAFGALVFENPKSLEMITQLVELHTRNNDLFLDFFAGSGTSAHAVMMQNKLDGGSRKFICVQLPELTKKNESAYKVGYKNIFDITKARIEKAAQEISSQDLNYEGDLGFKVFQTIPVFEGYLENIEILENHNEELFDGSTLSNEQLEDLLTTWKVYDGIPLTQGFDAVDLNGYVSYRYDKTLYLMHKGFKTESLKDFLSKLDATDGESKYFDIEKLVLFGYNFDSKHQLEINEAVRQYQNRKEKKVSVVVRY